MRILISILVVLLVNASLFSQKRTLFLSEANGTAIPFVNIYNDSLQVGLVTDIEGMIEIDCSELRPNWVLTFSCVGYETLKHTVAYLLRQEESCSIVLSATAYALEGVEVKAEAYRFKKRKAGISTRVRFAEHGFFVEPGYTGMEYGTIMKNDRECLVDAIGLNITEVTHDTMFYEVNMYHFTNGQPGEPLLRERIFLEFYEKDLGKPIMIDLADQQLRLDHDFFVSIEAVLTRQGEEEYGSTFVATLGGKQSLRKEISGQWKPVGMGLSIYTELRCFR